jgi:hypothetical protein
MGGWRSVRSVTLETVVPAQPQRRKNVRMASGALYRRFSVDRSTDLANLDDAFEEIQERRARRQKLLITMLLIAVTAVCAVVVAALR